MLIATAGVMIVVFAACPPPTPPLNPQSLPADANDACPLSPATFAGWFAPGPVKLDGVVNPANSLAFSNIPNCSFYQWSEQMFLWLTSPAPATYGGGGGRIFDSPAFFDVSPPAADGSRTFLPHTPGLIRVFNLRAAQLGPHRLPVIMDRTGRMLEIEPPKSGAPPLVRDVSGQLVEIAHARLEKGRLTLLDKTGKMIQPQLSAPGKPTDQAHVSNAITAQEFIIDRIPIFLDPSLAVVDVEQGQAGGGGVLEAQNGSLVYYATMVNDVYAYFATGVKDGAIAATTFPITAGDLSNITTFASAHGKTFPDPNALAVEVKSAWVEAAGLSNLSSYITMTATIPTYAQSSATLWTPNGQKTVQLALVGIHVVGSTAGHPEMIWSTFEHLANDPRDAYSYINTSNATINIPRNTAAIWLFSANNSSGPFNNEHMFFHSPNIEAVSQSPPAPPPPFTISASDTLRSEPFGIAGSNASSNTQVISTNNHVRGMLVGGDVRGNYIMTGATWTAGGAPPDIGLQVGTNALTNTTMETYQQGSNCFGCHSGNMLGTSGDNGLSHIFAPLKPLF
jgi:hypothetical protein